MNLDTSIQVCAISDNLTRNDPTYPFRILKKTIKNKPSIVHFQHEYLMYGFYGLPILFIMVFLRALRRPIVTTLHTVIPRQTINETFFERYGLAFLPFSVKKLGILSFTKILCQLSSLIVVHTNLCKRILQNHYRAKGEKIVTIHHGIDQNSRIPKEKAKQLLEMKGKKIMLCPGFIKPDKGLERAINALRSSEYSDHYLIIAGALPFRHTLIEVEYVRSLHNLVNRLALKERVKFIEHFLTQEELRILFSAADIVYLPYELDTCGASGIYCLAKSYNSLIVTSDVSRFMEDFNSDWNSVADQHFKKYLQLTS